jgi:hypothetical protein
MGCDFVQGYFFSPAVDAASAQALVAREREVLDGTPRAVPPKAPRRASRRLVA